MQIEDIISKVLEEIKKQEKSEEKRLTMVIIGDDFPNKEEIKNKYEANYHLEFLPCFDEKTEFDRLLLAQLTPNTLQKLAFAMDPDIGPVMKSLMKGKEIFYLKEGLLHERFKETCPKSLYKTYEDSVKKMTSFGILAENLKELKADEKHEGTVKKRGLITEREVLALVAKGDRILNVQKNTLITPLAKDLIRKHNVILEKQEGGISHANS